MLRTQHCEEQKKRDNAITFIRGFIEGLFRDRKKGAYYRAHLKQLQKVKEEMIEIDRFADESPATR